MHAETPTEKTSFAHANPTSRRRPRIDIEAAPAADVDDHDDDGADEDEFYRVIALAFSFAAGVTASLSPPVDSFALFDVPEGSVGVLSAYFGGPFVALFPPVQWALYFPAVPIAALAQFGAFIVASCGHERTCKDGLNIARNAAAWAHLWMISLVCGLYYVGKDVRPAWGFSLVDWALILSVLASSPNLSDWTLAAYLEFMSALVWEVVAGHYTATGFFLLAAAFIWAQLRLLTYPFRDAVPLPDVPATHLGIALHR